VRLTGATPIFVPLDESRDWAVNVAAFAGAITPNTRAIVLCHPNNPTGTLFSKEDLIALAELALAHDIVIIADEVYRDFLYDANDRESYFSLAMEPKYRNNVIRVFSFSKAFAMTGWRVGYLHTARSLAERILKIHDSLVTCAPVISQYAALAALEMKPKEWLPYRDEYKARRDMVCDALSAMPKLFKFVTPRSAYFLFPALVTENIQGYTDSHSFCLKLLETEGLALVPGSAFGPAGEHHVRISFGRSREDIAEGIERLKKYCHA
jgi:aminotransferase